MLTQNEQAALAKARALCQQRKMSNPDSTISMSFLRRTLDLGIAEAARVMDALEAEGVVGEFEGDRQRKIL